MSEEPPRNSHATTWTLCIIAVVVLYVGSIGPVLFLVEKGVLPLPFPHWLDVAYAPLGWLHDETALAPPMDAYVDWWEQLAHKP